MKIRVLYEDNIKNGHKNYTTIEIPDGDYSVMLDIDYEQRLAEANPEKKAEVKRCETLQEMFDLMNNKEYNHWRRYHRHLGNPKTPYRKDDEVEIDVMDTFADNSQEIDRVSKMSTNLSANGYVPFLVKSRTGQICSLQYALTVCRSVNMPAPSV